MYHSNFELMPARGGQRGVSLKQKSHVLTGMCAETRKGI